MGMGRCIARGQRKAVHGSIKSVEGIGIEFIEQDQKFSFGKILKSNTARALRRTKLEEEDKKRIRQRLVSMLLTGNVPHEYKQYGKCGHSISALLPRLAETCGLGEVF